MSTRKSNILIWLLALVIVLACVPALPSTSSIPTIDPGLINTYIAQTANAAATQTSAAIPTSTSTATLTPTPTSTETEEPTATNTVVFILKSPTPIVLATNTSTGGSSTSNKNYACELVSVSPANGTVYNGRTDFDAKWRVKNIGKKEWDKGSVDFVYDGGDKFHKVSGYDLGKNTKVGDIVDLIADMEAPKNSGTYTTYWTLKAGSEEFCRVSLTIVVK
ncbi:MAG: hypothetical protein C3F07_14295 [Anaerolineales bacterium]|nr:MAG: hypothetical protein C3F07_14295 [Anaerolineales bacterium]